MRYDPNDVNSWGGFSPLIIAHDVGRSRDRSTAVVGGNRPYGQRLLGVASAEELPQGLFGTARANALAAVDRRYHHNGLVVADLSYDPTYAEILVQSFGCRVIGLQISRFGNGMDSEIRPTQFGPLRVYKIGRTDLIESLHSKFQSDQIRLANHPDIRRAFDQLAKLDVEFREGGTVYSCPVGAHDDLGISLAMLNWAASHPHLPYWARGVGNAQRRRPSPAKYSWAAWT